MTLQYTSQVYTLKQDLVAGATISTLDFYTTETPVVAAAFVLKVGLGLNSEWILCNGLTSLGSNTYRTTVTARGLDKDAQTSTDFSTANEKNNNVDTVCKVVTHSYDWVLKMQNAGNNTLSGNNTFTGTNIASSTTKAVVVPQSVTTTQRDALTGATDGALVYNSTTGTTQSRNNGTFTDIPTGSTNPTASETQQGKVLLSTVSVQNTGASGGTTPSGAVLQPKHVKKTAASTQTDDAYKLTVLDANGDISRLFLPSKGSMFGGTGDDGVLSGSVGITGSDNTYIVKNYRSITAGAYTMTCSPNNCVVHIKVRGDADLTGWTFDFKGKGGQPTLQDGTTSTGGVRTNAGGQSGNNGGTGGVGNATSPRIATATPAGGGGQSATGGTAGTAVTSFAFTQDNINNRVLIAAGGCAGGGGGGGYNASVASGSVPPFIAYGGQGGAGGGCLILEVAGTVTFSSTTIDVRGNNGNAGSAGSGSGATGYAASGGGGGGAGGTFLCLYNAVSGSPTVQTTAGSAGAAGAGGGFTGGGAGGGGAGGSNIWATGSNGTAGNATGTAGAGGAGAAGASFLAQNTVFA